MDIPLAPIYNVSQTDICNNAWNLIGQGEIGDMADDTPQGAMCRRQFPSLLSAMLRDHDWTFNRRRTYLPQLSPDQIMRILGGFGSGGFGGGGFGGGSQVEITLAEPVGDYNFWYFLPNNFLRAWQINNTDDCKYTIEYGTLLTDESPVLLRYGAYVDDPNLWDAMFRMAFETLLAARFASRIPGDLALAAALKDEALGNPAKGIVGLFSQAKSVVGQEGTVNAYIVDDLTDMIRER